MSYPEKTTQQKDGELNKLVTNNYSQGIRRSRFPRAQPNISVSSGIARMRRLSGHFTSINSNSQASPSSHNESDVNDNGLILGESLKINDNLSSSFKEKSTPSNLSRPVTPKPSTPKQNLSTLLNEENFSNNNNIASLNNSLNLNQHYNNIHLKQYINHQNNITSQHENRSFILPITSPIQPQTPTFFQNTPCGSIYNPKFSSEHIMNIIKHKALQKLKKIETESLREKRKEYKKKYLAISSRSKGYNDNLNHDDVHINRSKLRMKDLLYYNPKNKKMEEVENVTETQFCNNENENSLPDSMSSTSSSLHTKNIENSTKKDGAAPQLKFADDGTIVINEESLVIQRDNVERIYDGTIIESEQNDNLTYNSYRKFHHTKKWSEKETAKFYKALSMIGTDFTMIQRLFSNRNRDEIKRKFKREEKLNQALIDKILSKTSEIDLSIFVSSGSEEDKQNLNKEYDSSKSEKLNQNLNDVKRKKQKLKRIKKREFIESETDQSDIEPSELKLNDKTSVSEKLDKIKNKNLVFRNTILAEKNCKSKSYPGAELNSNNSEKNIKIISNQNSDDDCAESVELILDLDNNFVEEINKTCINQKDTRNDRNDENNVIFDLDNNMIIKNNQLIKFNNDIPTKSTSKISILKINK